MPIYYPTQQAYQTYAPVSQPPPPTPMLPPPPPKSTPTGPTAAPSVSTLPTGPSNIPTGPTANGANVPQTEAPVVTVTPVESLTTGWKSWSTTKKAVVVGGGVLGLAAAVGILKALIR